MYDILSIGNICIDLYFKSKSFTHDNERFQLAIGGKYFAEYFCEDVGGGGVNVAAGLSKLGYKVALFGKIGNNSFKDIILKKLKNKNIDSDFCQLENDYFKVSTILLSEAGERTIINYESPSHIYKEFILSSQLKSVKNIYFGPLPNVSLIEKKRILNFFAGDKILTIVNLAINDCRKPINELKEIFISSDILILNAHEFAELIKKTYLQINFKEKSTYNQNIFKNCIVVVTDAEKGSYGFANNKVIYQPAIKPFQIIDTTGAGDGYTAGFIAEYLKSKDIEKSMFSGAKYAAKILTKIGAN